MVSFLLTYFKSMILCRRISRTSRVSRAGGSALRQQEAMAQIRRVSKKRRRDAEFAPTVSSEKDDFVNCVLFIELLQLHDCLQEDQSNEPGLQSWRQRVETMTGHGPEARERWVARASELLHTLFATFPGLPHTRLAQSKIQHNKVSGRIFTGSLCPKYTKAQRLNALCDRFPGLPHTRLSQS